jgi:hypothetical protein
MRIWTDWDWRINQSMFEVLPNTTRHNMTRNSIDGMASQFEVVDYREGGLASRNNGFF